MAALTIRRLDENVKAALRLRAARKGRSMEEEARAILREAVSPETTPGVHIAKSIREKIMKVGGVELEAPPRRPDPPPPEFGQ